MKIFLIFVIYVVVTLFLIKSVSLHKLSLSLYVPLCWMVLIFSRTLTQWLQYRGNFSGMEAEMEGNPVDATLLLILIFMGLRILCKRKLDIQLAIKNNKALFLFCALALLSLLWADFPFIAFKRWIRWFGNIVMVLVILTDKNYKATIDSLIKRCIYFLLPLSIIFIKFIPSLGRTYSRSGGVDYHGVATHKNQYGALLLVFGIYLAWELICIWAKKDSRALRKVGVVNLVFLIVIFWQLFFIDSKTSIICLLLGVFIITWLNFPLSIRNPEKAGKYIVAIAIFFAMLQHFADIKSTIVSLAGREPTLTSRTLLWADILGLQINRYVGTGWDNFWLGERVLPLWEKWPWHPRSAHNGYLEIYLYLGLVGIVLLIFVLIEAYKKSSALLIMNYESGTLALVFFFITLVYNYTESAFHRSGPVWFFALLFSFISISNKNGNNS